ncbi:MAG: hypothetical protein AB4050_07125 [Synechococcus sp.]
MTDTPFLRTIAVVKSATFAAFSLWRTVKPVRFGLAATLLITACSSPNSGEARTPGSESSNNSSSSEPLTLETPPEPSDSDELEPAAPETSSSDIEDSFASDSSFDLLPGFYPDPATDTGVISGTVEASSLTGTDSTPAGGCEGFINEAPDHQVNLRVDFSYLALEVESASPASLVIVGENGDRWCTAGDRPRIEQEAWSQGRYDIYVGNPETPASGDRYELSISEFNPNQSSQFGSAPSQEGPLEQAPPGSAFAGEDYQPISVAPGFEPDPAIGTGEVGGPLLATDVTGVADTETGECKGYIDTTADHFLTLEQPFRYLKVQAESTSPTSLVIVGPQGEAWCYTGNNPYIEGVWDAGEYEVYLANLDEAGVGDRYELLVTELE